MTAPRVLSSVTPADHVAVRPSPLDKSAVVAGIVSGIMLGADGGTFVLPGAELGRFVIGGAGNSLVIRAGATARRGELAGTVHAFVSDIPRGVDGVGFWRDSATGRVWLDAVTSTDSYPLAVECGRFRGELAIWDAFMREEIRI